MIRVKSRQNILYLASKQPSQKLSEFLKSTGHIITICSDTVKTISEFDLVVSFGYKHILKGTILQTAKRPPINLHISYLPFNRGYHPNFWAHYDGTLSGVSIHLIDSGIDSGDIVYRMPVEFKKNQNTFRQTWQHLNSEIEKLFIYKFNNILNLDFNSFKQDNKGTFHLENDLPKDFRGWDSNIEDEIFRLKST
jgi:methionyl-tRNA formyltransferase